MVELKYIYKSNWKSTRIDDTWDLIVFKTVRYMQIE